MPHQRGNDDNSRSYQWLHSERGIIKPEGLQIRSKGFKLKRTATIPHHPWSERLPRPAPGTHYCRDVADGEWHKVMKKEYVNADLDETSDVWNAQNDHSLTELFQMVMEQLSFFRGRCLGYQEMASVLKSSMKGRRGINKYC